MVWYSSINPSLIDLNDRSMWRFTVSGRMAASTLIVTALYATFVKVDGQCERCGVLYLSE